MQHFLKFGPTLLAGALLFASCAKKEDTAISVPAEQSQQTTDISEVKGESDQVTTDATDALSNFKSLNGRLAEGQEAKVVCGASIDSASLGKKEIKIKYDAITPCSSRPRRTRSGSISLKLVVGLKWQDQGSVLAITMEDYKVKNLETNKFILLNGTKYITNVRGSKNIAGILNGTDSLVYKERATNIIASLNGNATHTFSIARRTTWKFIKIAGVAGSPVRFTATGDTTLGAVTSLDTWGINRNNQGFTSAFTTPWVSNTYCGLAYPKSGQLVYIANGNTVTVTAGVNEQGLPDTRDCAYGYKVGWNLVGNIIGEKVQPY